MNSSDRRGINGIRLLGTPLVCSIAVVSFCIAGILIGSFSDFRISALLANKTGIGTWFANYGGYFSYCLYPAAGMCLFKGLKKKRLDRLAWAVFALSYFLAVHYCNSYFGKSARAAFGYEAGESPFTLSFLCYGLWVLLLSWVPLLAYFAIDDEEPELLISIGALVLIAGIASDFVNVWLKQVASRPRFKYLVMLDDPEAHFRNWWQWAPNLAGSNDSFKSWPSGNMTIATMMFALPLFADVLKKKSEFIRWSLFGFACAWVILYGYNRIHMMAHFLTDVCFGTLITYLVFAIGSWVASVKGHF